VERRVIWDEANRRHITREHVERGITVEMVEQVIQHPAEEYLDERHGTILSRGTVGGRRLLVAWHVVEPDGCYPVHARWEGR
jgi:hypothetical protein